MGERVNHNHEALLPCSAECTEYVGEKPVERRTRERRKPTVDKDYREGLVFLAATTYTGPVTVHVHEGVPKRIVLPNPEGW